MKKSAIILIGFLVLAIGYISYISLQARSPVLFCLHSTNTCTEYKNSEITATTADGYCVVIDHKREYCRPDFEIFELGKLKDTLKNSCDEDLSGRLIAWDTCSAPDGKWRYDEFKSKWILI